MANVSARDKCFQEAVDDLNDNLPDDQKIDIEHQKPWGKVDGVWRPLGVGERIWNWILDKTIPYRIPDWTITLNGKPTAGDNKFTGDKFQGRRSPRSNRTQAQDYNDINEQQHPGNSDYRNLQLNEDTCSDHCKGEPKQQEVLVRVPSFSGAWVPNASPRGLPSLGARGAQVPQGAQAPQGARIPEFEIPEGLILEW